VQVNDNADIFDDLLEELLQLIYSAGSGVITTVVQRRNSYDPSTIIGTGKIEEIKKLVEEEKPDLVIFLNDLKPGQERNLAEKLKVKVIDRQALILDIFAQRARTYEGKMQVELALLKYLLPRLAGLGPILSRLGGGIGTRGPGETMLETDRRHVRKRIQTLTRDIEKLRSHRELLRQNRHNRGYLTASLVGYTNSGKSTVLNLLTQQNVKVEDKLFATLDPTVGKCYIGNGIEMLLVDTVGFIRHLPHQLAGAFRATLEEVQEADIIIQVVDVSHPQWEEQLNVTEQVLEEMGCDNKPTVVLLNKTDLLKGAEAEDSLVKIPNGIPVSALKNIGFEDLREALVDLAEENYPEFVKRFKRRDDTYEEQVYSTRD
jgi:GTPase